MAKLIFDTEAVRELAQHALAAPNHREHHGEAIGPHLLLVKDQGVYLMSGGIPHLAGERNANKVVYAEGFDPFALNPGEVYDRARAALGGDDFAEALPREVLELIVEMPGPKVVIDMTEDSFEVWTDWTEEGEGG